MKPDCKSAPVMQSREAGLSHAASRGPVCAVHAARISVVIVSWNGRVFLRDCLKSLQETGGSSLREVIVVDNASTDGSPEMVAKEFPEVKFFQAGRNLGFAGANNLGLEHADGTYVALVNSDVVVHEGCLQMLARFLDEHDEVGLVGPRITGGDGQLQRTCRRLPTLWNLTCRALVLDRMLGRWPLFSGFQMRHWDYSQRAEVEVLSGCFWLARKSVFEAVGGLDERFFFYAEDLDWCKRVHEAGWKVVLVPEATATHFGGGSTANAPLRYSIENMRANLAYWKKHHSFLSACMFRLVMVLNHTVRLFTRATVDGTDASSGPSKFERHWVCLRWLLTGKGV